MGVFVKTHFWGISSKIMRHPSPPLIFLQTTDLFISLSNYGNTFFLLISLSYYGSFVFGFCVVAGCLTGILYKALLIIFPCSSCDIYHMIHKSELPPIFLSFNIKYLFIEKIPFNSSSSSSSKIIKDDSRTRLTKTQ